MNFLGVYMLNNYSPNMLKTYQTCPRKFYFQYVEKINVPRSNKPFEKGKKIHALANYLMQGINIDRLETDLTAQEKIIWQKLKENTYYQKSCFKSEFSLMCKIDKYWVGGRLDAIVYDQNDYYILDYKTGSMTYNPEYDYQTMVYLICLDRYLKDYKSLQFVYIDLKNNKDNIIEFDPQKRIIYTQKIQEICESINNDKTYQCNIENCQNCEYSKICFKN